MRRRRLRVGDEDDDADLQPPRSARNPQPARVQQIDGGASESKGDPGDEEAAGGAGCGAGARPARKGHESRVVLYEIEQRLPYLIAQLRAFASTHGAKSSSVATVQQLLLAELSEAADAARADDNEEKVMLFDTYRQTLTRDLEAVCLFGTKSDGTAEALGRRRGAPAPAAAAACSIGSGSNSGLSGGDSSSCSSSSSSSAGIS